MEPHSETDSLYIEELALNLPAEISDSCLEFNNEVFQWCLRNGQKALASANPESAAQWCLIAGRCVELFGYSKFSSSELEGMLLKISRTLPVTKERVQVMAVRKRWLHVFSKTWYIGGHTALAKRWIQLDPETNQHSLLLTFQEGSQAANDLVETIVASGGSVTSLGVEGSLLTRAKELREIAYREADYVVLHTHFWDVLPTIAFGVPGGPPILFLNHADHVFWVGTSVSDLILNLRSSGEFFSRKYRGVDRSFELPIPLPEPKKFSNTAVNPDEKLVLRDALGIPDYAIVFLTVGSEAKYKTNADLNFFETARRIIQLVPNAFLLAIGPKMENPDWLALHNATQKRVLPLGTQQELGRYFEISDIYLEGFPFGSLTALLEAGTAKLPCVRAPETCPLPFRSDGVALESLATPPDVSSYVRMAVALAQDKGARTQLGEQISGEIIRHHCGKSWSRHLQSLTRQLPVRHNVYPLNNVPAVPKMIERYWSSYLHESNWSNPLSFCVRSALAQSLRLRPDIKLWKAIRRLPRGNECRVKHPKLALMGGYALSHIPKTRLFDPSRF